MSAQVIPLNPWLELTMDCERCGHRWMTAVHRASKEVVCPHCSKGNTLTKMDRGFE